MANQAKKATEIRTSILIKATPEQVWRILMDFENYPTWNPFIKTIAGKAEKGARIVAYIEPPGAKGMTFKPKVLAVMPNKEFRWLGHLFIPGLFDGEHIFELSDNGDGTTTLVQRERFGGILIPLFKKMLNDNTLRGFEAMNEALKAKAEGGGGFEDLKI